MPRARTRDTNSCVAQDYENKLMYFGSVDGVLAMYPVSPRSAHVHLSTAEPAIKLCARRRRACPHGWLRVAPGPATFRRLAWPGVAGPGARPVAHNDSLSPGAGTV